MRVLMVDNNQNMCEGVAQYFRQHRPELILEATANSGLTGLQYLARYQPDCLIMDLMLPDLDGISVLERLDCLELPRRPKVLILSSFVSEATITSLSGLGVDFFMLKPCDLGSLADRVQQMCFMPLLSATPAAQACPEPETRIVTVLQNAGIPVHVQGYNYLRTAVEAVIYEDRLLNHVTKKLYPTVAERNNTTASRVERAIRHAIAMAWRQENHEKSLQYLGRLGLSRSVKPTNSEFIALVADRIRVEMRE